MGQTRLRFLGTGTSQGVPIVGCDCEVCRSTDPRDKRFRAAALVEYKGLTILIDCGPDFRSQMIAAGVRHVDAILLTHNHMDHVGGLDDVRAFNYIDRKTAEIYCEDRVLDSLKIMYSYAFVDEKYPGAPEWRVHRISEQPFLVYPNDKGNLEWVREVGYCHRLEDGSIVPCDGNIVSDAFSPDDSAAPEGGVEIIPIRGFHGKMPVLGFRFGDIAYITDMSYIPEEEFVKLKGLKHLTLNTVSYHPHHSHFSYEEALALAKKIGAEHTWLTHLAHAFPRHEEFMKQLPEGVAPAYDGLIIED